MNKAKSFFKILSIVVIVLGILSLLFGIGALAYILKNVLCLLWYMLLISIKFIFVGFMIVLPIIVAVKLIKYFKEKNK